MTSSYRIDRLFRVPDVDQRADGCFGQFAAAFEPGFNSCALLFGRRGELSALTVSAINKASKMSKPMLEFITLKQGFLKIRQVPVTNILLSQARKFINTQRAEALKKYTKSGKLDHDQLFVSFSTGKPLADTAITNEIHILRKAADIEEQACAHMFRHAFALLSYPFSMSSTCRFAGILSQ